MLILGWNSLKIGLDWFSIWFRNGNNKFNNKSNCTLQPAVTHVISSEGTRTMLLLTLNIFHTSFCCFDRWLWTNFRIKKKYVQIFVVYDVNIIVRRFIDYVNTFETNLKEKALNQNYVTNNLKMIFTTLHIRKLFWRGSGKLLKTQLLLFKTCQNMNLKLLG